MPPQKMSFNNQASKMVAASNREQGLTGPRRRGAQSQAAQRRTQAGAGTRSKRYNFSEADSDKEENDEEDEEPASQGPAERTLRTLFQKSREEAAVVAASAPVYVKTERPSSQHFQTQNAKAGPSKPTKTAPVIDLTFETTDDDAPGRGKGKAVVQSREGSQGSTTSSKGGVKRKKAVTPVDRKRVQRMMSGGSGRSEEDSIVLLDSEEEEGKKPINNSSPQKPALKPVAKANPAKPSPVKPAEPPATSHNQTMAQWRGTASKAQSSTQSSSLPRSSQPSKLAPTMQMEPPTSSPTKDRSPLKPSQTSDASSVVDKRMELAIQEDGDVDMDSGKARPAHRRGTSLVLEVEIPLPPRRSSRTPVRTGSQSLKSPLRPVVGSPVRESTSRTPTKTPNKTPSKTPTRTSSKLVNDISSNPLTDTPHSSVLSSISSRSGSRTPQQAPQLPVTTEEFDRLASLVRDVPVKFSDAAATPTKASASQPARALGKSETLQTPSSKRTHEFSSPSRLSVPSSLPPKSHRDLFTVLSPSKRASMDRPYRPQAKSAHTLWHQDFFAKVAEKRKSSGTPIVEEVQPDSPAKRRHLSQEEPKAPVAGRARRAKPVFATSSPVRTQAVVAMAISPARSIRTDRSAPNTPSRFGGSLFMTTTETASPVRDDDTDRSYVSSSVMEEKMPMLIPYERLNALLTEDGKMDVQSGDGGDVDVELKVDNVEMEVDENANLMDLFGDFDWTDQAPAPVEESSTTPVSKSVEETDESLIDGALRPVSQIPDTSTSNQPLASPDISSRPTEVASRKGPDIFAELKAQHERDEEEKREKEEAARKKMLEDSEGDESDDDLTSLLVITKPPVAVKLESDKGTGYGLRSSMEPTAKPTRVATRVASVAPRAAPVPAALAKMHREMKKEKRPVGGMTAMEKARLNLEQLEDEKEAEAAGTPAREAWVRPTAQIEEEVYNSDTEDDFMADAEDEAQAPNLETLRKAMDPDGNLLDVAKQHSARAKPVTVGEETPLKDFSVWRGLWEDLAADLPVPDVQTSFSGFAALAKSPRLLMAVVPSMVRKHGKEGPLILLNITNTFPSHPIANTAVRLFVDHPPEIYDAVFWKHQLLRTAEKHRNDPASRLRATTHWLRCLAITLRKCRVPDEEICDLVLLLVKLAIDRGSGDAVKRAVMECVDEALRDTSDDMLLVVAKHLAAFSEPFAVRKMRVRIAQAVGVVSPKARKLKSLFALHCLTDGAEEEAKKIDLCSLPTLMKDQSLPCLSGTSESPRLVLSGVRMLIYALTHVHDVIDHVGDAGLRSKHATLSEAEARKPDWEVKRNAATGWRVEMLDALRWLKTGMYNKGKKTSFFRQIASSELTSFLNRFEQSSKYYLDILRPRAQPVATFFKVKTERGTPGPVERDTRGSSVASVVEGGTPRPGGRPKPMRRVKVE